MYYFNDGISFASKVKAIAYGNSINEDPKLYYFDEIYDKVVWNAEPYHSLPELYKMQAQRIRDTYDKVILCYSGGADSTCILETFHYNNIGLDKIVTVGALSQDSHSMVDENHNGELYHNVFPYIDELGLQSITEVIDYTTYFDNVNNFSITQYSTDWIDYTGAWFSPHNWFWRDIEKHIIPTSWSDKKVAIIFGKDKPCMFLNNNKQGFKFYDGPTTSYGNVFSVNNSERINFFWDPAFTDILVKQLHIIKRYSALMNKDPTRLTMEERDNIVYDLKKPLIFKSPKSPTGVFSLRDMYLLDKKNSDVFSYYKAGMSKMKSMIDLKNITVLYSKFYSIE